MHNTRLNLKPIQRFRYRHGEGLLSAGSSAQEGTAAREFTREGSREGS